MAKQKHIRKGKSQNYVSTGSTMLNLACTDFADRGLRKGHYYLFVGDSRSGKTWLAHAVLAEAACNPAFDNYRLIYDDVEGGALMNIRRFFGEKLANRIEPPKTDEGKEPASSHTIEEFYANLDDVCEEGKPFIYVLDSHDCLDSEFAKSKFDEQKSALQNGTDAAGSYGDGKAKINSGALRRYIKPLKQQGSILLLINQTRDRLSAGRAFGKTTAGGWALHFYATLEIWTSIEGDIQKKVRGISRTQGVLTRCRVKKNRITGKDKVVTFPIYNSYGIDDLGSCIDYLISEKYWTASKNGIVNASDLNLSGHKETIIQKIQAEHLEEKLQKIVQTVWRDVEQELVLQRTPKYT